LTANKSFILGYTKEDFGIFEDTPVIIFDDFTTDNKYVDFAFKVKSSAIKILRRKGKNNLKMIFELMNQIKFEAAEHKRYYISEYQNLIVKLPKPAEQQKIADCLSSLDELITAQAQKVEALKTHKKALMWRLFPREGESIPRLRFPEFQNAPEWERKPLGDIFNFLRGSLFSKENIVENGTNKCIHYGELFTIYKEKIFEIKSSTNLENGQFSQNGDILMPSSDVTPEGLATASAIFEAGVIIGGDVNILRPKNQVSSLFISYLLNFSKKDIMKLVTGTTVKHIYNKDIAKLDIKIPLQLKEQQKIADCLSSLDELITAQAQKVEALKTHKKALMQRLFPDTGGK
jgi:type I restriction enzyme S subunit